MNTTISDKHKYSRGYSTAATLWNKPYIYRIGVPDDFFLESSSEEFERCNDDTAMLVNESIRTLAHSRTRKSHKTAEEFLQHLDKL